jgi:hypothetical protein
MNREINDLSNRIKELGDKSTQLLTFLSFALVVVVLLWSSDGPKFKQNSSLVLAMYWWVRAIFPILIGILPWKEFRENNLRWYKFIRWSKVGILWLAIGFIFRGVYLFARTM